MHTSQVSWSGPATGRNWVLVWVLIATSLERPNSSVFFVGVVFLDSKRPGRFHQHTHNLLCLVSNKPVIHLMNTLIILQFHFYFTEIVYVVQLLGKLGKGQFVFQHGAWPWTCSLCFEGHCHRNLGIAMWWLRCVLIFMECHLCLNIFIWFFITVYFCLSSHRAQIKQLFLTTLIVLVSSRNLDAGAPEAMMSLVSGSIGWHWVVRLWAECTWVHFNHMWQTPAQVTRLYYIIYLIVQVACKSLKSR